MFLFEIIGKPTPQIQTRFRKCSNKIFTWDPSKANKEYIQLQSRPYAPNSPLFGPIQLDLTFYLPIPKSTSIVKTKQMINQVIHHTSRPDVDNLAYIVTNALKDIFYHDDRQIIDLYLHKRYGEIPKTVVKITPIEELAKTQGDECG
jgi:Holliday junction resolvase RusA-like endonuclease